MNAPPPYRPCPVYTSSAITVRHNDAPDTWKIGQCSACDFVFLRNPVDYTALKVEDARETTYETMHQARAAKRGALRRVARQARILGCRVRGKRAQQYFRHREPGPVLDIGCGDVVRFEPPRTGRQLGPVSAPRSGQLFHTRDFGARLRAGRVRFQTHQPPQNLAGRQYPSDRRQTETLRDRTDMAVLIDENTEKASRGPARAFGVAFFLGFLGAASVANAATDQDNREQLFSEFCLTPGSPQATVDALRASPKTGPLNVTEISGRRYISFPIKGLDRAVVTVINPSVGGLWCSVGIKNVGINLYTNGRVVRE